MPIELILRTPGKFKLTATTREERVLLDAIKNLSKGSQVQFQLTGSVASEFEQEGKTETIEIEFTVVQS